MKDYRGWADARIQGGRAAIDARHARANAPAVGTREWRQRFVSEARGEWSQTEADRRWIESGEYTPEWVVKRAKSLNIEL